ncbi:hypothetical protein HanRHA438_Chr05g0203001 [Helianthus annuus]|nr:hypothetical protein HanRHA438_Chr05g0203001 [Helianthus annuus]
MFNLEGVTVPATAIDEESVRRRNASTHVQYVSQPLVAFFVPITSKNSVISGRERKRDWNTRAAVDFNAAIASSSLLKAK